MQDSIAIGWIDANRLFLAEAMLNQFLNKDRRTVPTPPYGAEMTLSASRPQGPRATGIGAVRPAAQHQTSRSGIDNKPIQIQETQKAILTYRKIDLEDPIMKTSLEPLAREKFKSLMPLMPSTSTNHQSNRKRMAMPFPKENSAQTSSW